ncbi:MAG: O-acetyl-ADP-ribose deacetylase [Cyanobacteria bacterium SID2]|nr:O-acetyl-ADP-ribose deacetylase [Cyanobacteria bacterium SID2]MBP0006013.1 O-acetyl-ADP-ribose deacetylase [Cyanobacteria bacterium SBC]
MIQNRIEILNGDITALGVDAIVNAANNSLLGGGGVDGAIHRAAGSELLEECKTIGGCPTGEARITRSYNLPAQWVVHTVGPIWYDGTQNEEEMLAACYRNSLALAKEHGIQTIAFPAISTGVYRFPMERATNIAIRETVQFLQKNNQIAKVILVCYGDRAFKIYREALKNILSEIL